MPVIKGNRLPVPKALGSHHFFYYTNPPAFDPKHVKCVVEHIKAQLDRQTYRSTEVSLFTYQELMGSSKSVADAFCALMDAFKSPVIRREQADVLACQWAPAHVDDSFAGSAFYSVVLHTGPHPYIMELLHTQKQRYDKSQLNVVNTAKELRCGDAFIFDPTTPHYAAPKIPHQRELLILLQTELNDDTKEERKLLLKAHPPLNLERCVY